MAARAQTATVPPPARPDGAAASGWLLRLPNYVGDTVCALPALHRLAAAGPLLAFGKPWALPLLAAAGIAARVYPQGLRARVAALREAAQAQGTRRILLLTNGLGSALEARLAGLRPLGYARHGRRLLLHESAGPLPAVHLVEGYQRLVDRVPGAAPRAVDGAPPWSPVWPGPRANAARLAAAAERLRQALGHDAPYALLVPRAGGGHGGASKDWPHFGALLPLLRAAGLRVLMAPGPGEAGAFAAAAPEAEVLAGLDLVALGLLAAGARLVIAPDCGPAHLAAAAGAPVLAVFGPTAPARSRPWSPRAEVLGGDGAWPAREEVEAAILRLLASHKEPHAPKSLADESP
jgi:heptosyltransferase-2